MSEYIEREALIEGRVCNDPVRIAAMYAPAADVAPVVHGEWKKRPVNKINRDGHVFHYCDMLYCSECHFDGLGSGSAYCPRCGAEMGGEKHE